MFFSSAHCVIKDNIYPLRVHQRTHTLRRKRTSQSASEEGSMTVEAALVIPLLLCAFLGILLWGKVFLIHQDIESALMETARQIARQEALLTMQEKEGTGMLSASFLFSQNCHQSEERHGLEVSSVSLLQSEYRKGTKEVFLNASYTIKIPIPLLGTWRVKRNTSIVQKAWNGYADCLSGTDLQEQYVYITEHGTSYHRDSQCYHLHVTIEEVSNTGDYYGGRTSYRPCEFCISGENKKSVLYICEDGECYHEDLSCGGLTRTVRYVKMSQIGGRKACADCGGE